MKALLAAWREPGAQRGLLRLALVIGLPLLAYWLIHAWLTADFREPLSRFASEQFAAAEAASMASRAINSWLRPFGLLWLLIGLFAIAWAMQGFYADSNVIGRARKITTKRLTLRRALAADIPALHAILSDPDTLRIIVRDQGYFDYVTRGMPVKDKRLTPVYRPIGDGLYALLAFDMPEAIGALFEESLPDMGLSAEAAWTRAMAQTRTDLPPLPTGSEILAGPVGREGLAYVASMLVDLPAWERLAITAGPNMFVAITTDQFMVIGVMPDGAEFDKLKEHAAEECRRAERCISPLLYRLRKGRWVAAD